MNNKSLVQLEVAGATGRYKIVDDVDPTASIPSKIWNDPNTIVERKLDGHRFKMHIFAEGNRFDSRRPSVAGGLFVEKTDNAPHLRDYVIPELAGTVLDGELCAGKDSNSVAHALGSHASDEEKKALTYVVFDIIMFKGENVTSKTDKVRRALLELCFKNTLLGKSSSIELMVRPESMTVEQKKKTLLDALAAGEEGVMIKDTGKPYGKGWTKVKKEARYDVIVTGYDPPEQFSMKKGDTEPTETKFFKMGWIGAIKFGQVCSDGVIKEMGKCSGMTDDVREDFSRNREKYIGSVIEIAAQERFPTGKFRHPRFIRLRAGEKLANDCIYRPDEI